MQEAGEEVGFGGDGQRVCGGEVGLDRAAWEWLVGVVVVGVWRGGVTVVVDAHAVVEGFFPELLFRVGEHGARERGGGEGDLGDAEGGGRGQGVGAQESGHGARLRGPAVGF